MSCARWQVGDTKNDVKFIIIIVCNFGELIEELIEENKKTRLL